MRWAKITSQAQAQKATGHNYRTDRVANADQSPPHPNVEFINTAQRGYWELAEERIAEVVTRKVRDDQVRCMEVILTASPEHFERDEHGRAVNMAGSQWAKDQVDFLKKTFGEKNVLSCTLHQDEKSPHFHAVIVPITADGRLSAKELFNPRTLTSYQSEYAEVMTVHGLSRGVKHSQAKHQDMKHLYAQQAESSAVVGAQLGPASSYQDVEVKRPSVREMLNLTDWEAKTTARVNEQARAQVEEANQRAEKAANMAQENAAASERVRALQKQLETVAGLKEGYYETMQQAQGEVRQVQGELATVAMRLAGGEQLPAPFIEKGNRLLDELSDELKAGRAKVVEFNQEAAQAERRGDYGALAELRYGKVRDQEKENKPVEDELGRFVGGKVRLANLDREQAKREVEQAKAAAEQAHQAEQAHVAAQQAQAEQARQAEQQAQEAKTRLAQEQAAEKVFQEALAQERAIRIREHERAQIERVTADILINHSEIYQVQNLIDVAAIVGIEIQNPVKGTLLLRLAGSVNEFTNKDIEPAGQDFVTLFRTRTAGNREREEREQARGRSNDMEIG